MRFTVTVRSEKHQTLFQAYQGPREGEAELIASLCVQAITAANGEAVVNLRSVVDGEVESINWSCQDGKTSTCRDALWTEPKGAHRKRRAAK